MLLTHVVVMHDEYILVEPVEHELVKYDDFAKLIGSQPIVHRAIKYKTLDDIPDPKIRDRVAVLKLVPVSDAIEGYGIRASENIFWITTIGENEHE